MTRVLILVGVVIGATAVSQERRPIFVYGAGTATCGKWLQARDEITIAPPTRFVFESWVHGYLSGLSSAGRDLRDSDRPAIAAWMDTYCTEHPLDRVDLAAGHLAVELMQKP
jgi:hypothetical protein